jgi:hypothetical protein
MLQDVQFVVINEQVAQGAVQEAHELEPLGYVPFGHIIKHVLP